MGGCASKPKELDGASAAAPVENSAAEPEVSVKHVDADAPQEEVKAENLVENNESSKEAPLVDLSSPKAEAEKVPAVELASEISELKAGTEQAAKAEAVVAKEDVPAPAPVVVEEKDEVAAAAVKVEEFKEPALVVDDKKVSA